MPCATAFTQQSPEQLFQAGIYAEEIKGELQDAVKIYQRIVQEYSDNRPTAAKAQLHIGICYEKLGQQQARAAYQKVLENYPDQRKIVARAREHLSRLKPSAIQNQKSEISSLVKYYFDRLGIDILTSTSPDGKYLAYTDWTTGNLMIKNLSTANRKKLTDTDWSRSPEFALHPVWSRDGNFIAYGWYRKSYFTELRIVEVAAGISRVVYSNADLSLAPQDWLPDGTAILCVVENLKCNILRRMLLISLDSSEVRELLPLDRDSRGLMFSPDGKYIAYDLQHGEDRQIYVLEVASSHSPQITSGLYGRRGFDAPIWSPDGKLLFRSFLRGQYDLWEIPMHNGKPSAEPVLIQSDLTNALLSIKGISHDVQSKTSQSLSKCFISHRDKKNRQSFFEDFSSPVLDSSWFVVEWNKPNVYDYATFGRYSLSDHPGHLRYYLDPIMSQGYLFRYSPTFSGWYWGYPSLEINRILDGDFWELEARVTYSMADGVNGRDLQLVLCFDPERDRETSLIINRGKDIDLASNRLLVLLRDRGVIQNGNDDCRAPGDTLGVTNFTYIYRITRADTLIHVELSYDEGENFRRVLSGSLRSDLHGLPQLLVLTGSSWFVPAGSYADWDYIRFRNLDF
ncbi:MAG: tetratricopeptide repeat protein [candidate division KSB1 bacterium]|nr:tetratricopeptide repeat protein [candidate division KSB1 bacterium]MDZ7301181.1 tetratricopeptide repeat protein [candidate division KSB1 bacterium]